MANPQSNYRLGNSSGPTVPGDERQGAAEGNSLHYGDYTVLIIDDTHTNLKIIGNRLHAVGLTVLTAANGEDGVKRALLGNPDIILLDVIMPGIDGFETCRRLKANPATAAIPVIFMTALTETEHKVAAFAAGAVDYVTDVVGTGFNAVTNAVTDVYKSAKRTIRKLF